MKKYKSISEIKQGFVSGFTSLNSTLDISKANVPELDTIIKNIETKLKWQTKK